MVFFSFDIFSFSQGLEKAFAFFFSECGDAEKSVVAENNDYNKITEI